MAYGQVSADVINTSVSGSSLGAGNASLMKNRIINGAMLISQRGSSFTPANGDYTLDRWQYQISQSSKLTVATSTDAPTGFSNSMLVTSSSAYSVGAGDYFSVLQSIEGFNTYDLSFGNANAKTITLSFWVKSSLTGTFGGTLINGSYSRAYPFTYTISSASTWTQISVTIAGDTTGTWVGATNGVGLQVNFGLGVGANNSATAGSWTGAGKYSATGAVSVVGTNGATWQVTGVQLEVGSSATGYEYRQYGQELALCQRYYWKQAYTVANNRYGTGVGIGDTTIDAIIINLPVTMRSSPTNSFTALGAYDGTSARNVTALNTNYSTNSVFAQQATADGSFTAGKVIQLYATGSTSFVSSSAEL
jgi:hypothetical protein